MKKFYYYLYMAMAVVYLSWRIGWTFNSEALIFSLIFLLCEFHDVWNTSIVFRNLALYVNKSKNTPIDDSFVPSIDVFITTYDENPDLVEVTINAACQIDFPCNIWVLDDGKRDELKEYCLKKNINYLTRDDNKYAKAGNLNHALAKSKADFILTLDADIVPFPEIVKKVISNFKDPKLALIQMPQEFYNPNSFGHNPVNSQKLSHWNDQTLFFYYIQPGKDSSNSSFWCGTPSMLRRSAFESIGGVQTGTITEDIQTTIRLHSEGWKTMFHKEVLALGLAPDTLESFLIQRYRWASGTFQLLHSRENPITISGLTIRQRVEYVWTILFYLSPISKIIIYFSALLSYIVGELPMKNDIHNILIPLILFSIASNILLKLNLKDAIKIWRVEILRFCLLPVYLKALGALFVKKTLPFIVTPKEPDQRERETTRRLLRPHIQLVLISSTFFVLGILDFLDFFSLTKLDKDDLLIALFWMIPGILVPIISLRAVLNRTPTEREHRFTNQIGVDVQCNGETLNLKTENLSFLGLGIIGDVNLLEKSQAYHFVLKTEQGAININGEVVWINKDKTKAGVRLKWEKNEDKGKYLDYCYGFLPKQQLQTLEFPRIS